MSENTFQLNDLVELKSVDNFIIGRGIIKGIASIPQVLLGATYIIEDLSNTIPNETYPYTHYVMPEMLLKKVENVILRRDD